ncbi:hypothetical protein K488DRAFT_75117 [Vararia minispora EC-137]|uniref:Uncharacterized protein n=1 Tax=Vararia minispora EC-137 TaxID=1314806 RepID=A0ACB8Q4P0_9AGAM|nr:hypothetical protein K488DRAFT_75117 [Vararia minispora EC-137]
MCLAESVAALQSYMAFTKTCKPPERKQCHAVNLSSMVIGQDGCVERDLCCTRIRISGSIADFAAHYDSHKCCEAAKARKPTLDSRLVAAFRSFFTAPACTVTPIPDGSPPIQALADVLLSPSPTWQLITSSPTSHPSSLPPLSPGGLLSLPQSPTSLVPSVYPPETPPRTPLPASFTSVPDGEPRCPHSPDPLARRLLEELDSAIAGLPSSIPEAAEGDEFYEFAEWGINVPDPELVWQCLNQALDRLIGYDQDVQAVSALVWQGQWGITYVAGMIRHYVQTYPEQIEGVLLEPKIRKMVDVAILLGLRPYVPNPVYSERARACTPCTAHAEIYASTSPDHPNSPDIIEVVSYARKTKGKSAECKGFELVVPHGCSALASYPVLLHNDLNPPWSLHFIDGLLYLCVTICTQWTRNVSVVYDECVALPCNATLMKIVSCMDGGIHRNTKGLLDLLRQKDRQQRNTILLHLNQTCHLTHVEGVLSTHKSILRAIASKRLPNVNQALRVAMCQGMSASTILQVITDILTEKYKPKGFTDDDRRIVLVLLHLGGRRVLDFTHLALGLPAMSTVCTIAAVPLLQASPATPSVEDITQNVDMAFGPLLHGAAAIRRPVHGTVGVDEIATEVRLRWNDATNHVLWICREHIGRRARRIDSYKDIEVLVEEATVCAVTLLSPDTRLGSARPIAVSGTCKAEKAPEHQRLLQTVLDGIAAAKALQGIHIVCYASDGLSRESNIYPHLGHLPLLNLWVGDDNLTANKDYKHVAFKRVRNTVLRADGINVLSMLLTSEILCTHLRDEAQILDLKEPTLAALFNVADKQDVNLVYRLAFLIWELRRVPIPNHREATTLTSALPKRRPITLEAPVVRTMVGNDLNADMPQLAQHLSHSVEVTNVFVEHKEWDQGLHRLQITALGPNMKPADNVDHISTSSWCGDTCIDGVNLGVCWSKGCFEAEDSHSLVWESLTSLTMDATILAPFGGAGLLFSSHKADDSQEDGPEPAETQTSVLPTEDARNNCADSADTQSDSEDQDPWYDDPRCEFEDRLQAEAAVSANMQFTHMIWVSDIPMNKSRALAAAFWFCTSPSSTDRLQRVQGVSRYHSNGDEDGTTLSSTDSAGSALYVNHPIATLLLCEGNLFLAIGDIICLKVHSKRADHVLISLLNEPHAMQVTYQLLWLISAPADNVGSPNPRWQASGLVSRLACTVAGLLVLPINPNLTGTPDGTPAFTSKGEQLLSLAMALNERIVLSHASRSDAPKIAPNVQYPYRNDLGHACFLVEYTQDDDDSASLGHDLKFCPLCKHPPTSFDSYSAYTSSTIPGPLDVTFLKSRAAYAAVAPTTAKYSSLNPHEFHTGFEVSDTEHQAMGLIWSRICSRKAPRLKKDGGPSKLTVSHSHSLLATLHRFDNSPAREPDDQAHAAGDRTTCGSDSNTNDIADTPQGDDLNDNNFAHNVAPQPHPCPRPRLHYGPSVHVTDDPLDDPTGAANGLMGDGSQCKEVTVEHRDCHEYIRTGTCTRSTSTRDSETYTRTRASTFSRMYSYPQTSTRTRNEYL